MRFFLFLLILMFVISCSKKIDVGQCDQLSSNGGFFSETTYDCPTGDPKNDDIEISEFKIGNIEAGFVEKKSLLIRNIGDSKIFDFKTVINGANVLKNTCNGKFLSNGTCFVEFEINKEKIGKYKFEMVFSDRTGKLNKKIEEIYSVYSSYPVNKEIPYKIHTINYDLKKIEIGPLVDKFNNIVTDIYSVESDKKLSDDNFLYLNNNLTKISTNGEFQFYIKTDQLEQDQLTDSAYIKMSSMTLYKDGTNISKTIDLSFIGNKPIMTADVLSISVDQNSKLNKIGQLKAGEDPNNKKLSYIITKKVSHGTIENCLYGEKIESLINCEYTPDKNFYGKDSFSYKAFNGENYSYREAVVDINVLKKESTPYFIINKKNISVKEGLDFSIDLNSAYDYNGENLQYLIKTPVNNGSLVCSSNSCTYKSYKNTISKKDFFEIYAKNSSGIVSLDSLKFDISIEDINEAPILGGSLSRMVTQGSSISLTLPPAQDNDVGDELKYKIKKYPQKGKVFDCFLNNFLSCSYKPSSLTNDSDSFSYVAVDKLGLESEEKMINILITPVNQPPQFNTFYQEEQVASGNTLSFMIPTPVDPEGNSFSYTVTTYPQFGMLQGCLINGTNSVNCVYIPNVGVDNKIDYIKYKAIDNIGSLSPERTIKINISRSADRPIIAGTLSLDTVENVNKDFDLLPAIDDITPQENIQYKIGLIKPQNGKLVGCADMSSSESLSDRSCSYVPNKYFYGNDSFSYFAIDARNLQSEEKIVTITVNNINNAPTSEVSQIYLIGKEDSKLLFSKPAGLIDPDGDQLNSTILDAPKNGSLSIGCFSGNNNCEFTPNANFFGDDSFKIRIADEFGLDYIISYYVSISNVNDPPTIESNNLDIFVNEDSFVDFSLKKFNDIDSNVESLMYKILKYPKNGRISGCLQIDGNYGLNCLYTPDSNFSGSDSFSYLSYDDENSNSVETIVNLTVLEKNDPPYFERVEKTIYTSINSSVVFESNLAIDLDDSQSQLRYEIITEPKNGRLSDCVFVGKFSCKFTADAVGEDIIIYRASDGKSSSFNTGSVKIYIENEKKYRIGEFKNIQGIPLQMRISSPYEESVLFLDGNYVFNSVQGNGDLLSLRRYDGNFFSFPNILYKNKSVVFNNSLYIIDESTGSNKIRRLGGDGTTYDLSYDSSIKIFSPTAVSDHIYFGSENGAIFRLNQMQVGNQSFSFLDKVVLNINLDVYDNSFVKPVGKLDDLLFYLFKTRTGSFGIGTYSVESKLATNISFNNSIWFEEIKNVFEYKSIGGGINRLFFIAKKNGVTSLFYIDKIDQKIKEISINKSAQAYLENPKLLKNPQTMIDFILWENINSKRINILRPDLLTLTELESVNDVSKIAVSENNLKLLINTSSGLFVSRENLTEINRVGEPCSIMEKINSEEFVIINNNHVSVLDKNNNMIPVKNDQNNIFIKTMKTDKDLFLLNSVGKMYIFKKDYSYFGNSIKKPIYLDSISDELKSISNVENLNLIEGASIKCSYGDCIYSQKLNSVGLDVFDNKISYSDGTFEEKKITVVLQNEKPKVSTDVSLTEIVKIKTANKNIIDYYVVNSIPFYVSNINSSYSVVSVINGVEKTIFTTNNEIKFLSGGDSFHLLIVEKSASNKLLKYSILDNKLSTLFQDNSSSIMEINDIIEKNGNAFILAKNYGDPTSDKLIKINVETGEFVPYPLPANFIDGKFVDSFLDFYVVSKRAFASFDQVSGSFKNTEIVSRDIELTSVKSINNGRIISFLSKKIGYSNVFDRKFYNVDGKSFIESSVDFPSSVLTIPQNYSLKNIEVFDKINNDGRLDLIEVEIDADFSSDVLKKIAIKAKDDPQLVSATNNHSKVFQNYQNLYKMKKIRSEFYFISENLDYLSIVKFGDKLIKENYLVYGKESNVSFDRFFDKNKDPLAFYLDGDYNNSFINILCNSSGLLTKECSIKSSGFVKSSLIPYFAFDGIFRSENDSLFIYMINTAPENKNQIESFDVLKNNRLLVSFDNSIDADGNNLNFIITDYPKKGSLAGCNLSEINIINNTNVCEYIPNLNEIGNDSFKYVSFDGNKKSNETIVNISINNSDLPVFQNKVNSIYIGKNWIDNEIIIDSTYQSGSTYSVVKQLDRASMGACFYSVDGLLKCRIIPNNLNTYFKDSFSYKACLGQICTTKVINVIFTGFDLPVTYGDLIIKQSGVVLLKNGVASSDPNLRWDSSTKTVFLKYYNNAVSFDSINICQECTLQIELASKEHQWIEMYVLREFVNNGKIKVDSVYSNGSYFSVNKSTLNGEQITYQSFSYKKSAGGGRSGGSSFELNQIDDYFFSTDPLFGSSGQDFLSKNNSVSGGKRGRDSVGLYIYSDKISGNGSFDVSGENGSNGEDGANGISDGFSLKSFGGSGGGSGGNGGNAGKIILRFREYDFGPKYLFSGGSGGTGGSGGAADFTYNVPFIPENGIPGQNGIDGETGSCQLKNIDTNSVYDCL